MPAVTHIYDDQPPILTVSDYLPGNDRSGVRMALSTSRDGSHLMINYAKGYEITGREVRDAEEFANEARRYADALAVYAAIQSPMDAYVPSSDSSVGPRP